MFILNDRLSLCAGFVTKGGVAVDVGTDHAYLAAFLVLNNISDKVIACDINEGPLLSAKHTLEKCKINEKVTLIQSDGLKNVPNEGVTDVIIAGMGGELISQIIGNANWLKQGVNLVLQAMTKAPYLRKWLYVNGYEIIEEKAVEDENFIYTVINAKYNGECKSISEYFSETGKLDFKDEVGKRYLLRQAKRLENIAKQMANAENMAEKANQYLNLSDKILKKVESENDNSR